MAVEAAVLSFVWLVMGGKPKFIRVSLVTDNGTAHGVVALMRRFLDSVYFMSYRI